MNSVAHAPRSGRIRRLWFSETRSTSARLQDHPVFDPAHLTSEVLRRAVICRDPTSAEETLLSPKQFVAPGFAPGPRRSKPPSMNPL